MGENQKGVSAMWLARALVLIGAINWGLIGLLQFDLVAALFGGQAAWFSRVIYTLVGVSGLAMLVGMGMRNPVREGGREDH